MSKVLVSEFCIYSSYNMSSKLSWVKNKKSRDSHISLDEAILLILSSLFNIIT